MNYVRESFDLPPFALLAAAFALFTLGLLASGPIVGGIVVTSSVIVRELAMHWIGTEVAR